MIGKSSISYKAQEGCKQLSAYDRKDGSQKYDISGTSKSEDFEHQNSQSFNAPKPHDGFDGKKASEGKEAD